MTSSPVYECGPRKNVTTTSSTSPAFPSSHIPTVAARCSRTESAEAFLKNRLATADASLPDIRTTPMPLRPIGVEIATIVSSLETILCNPSSMTSISASLFRPGSGGEFCFGVGRPVLVYQNLLNDADHVAGQPIQDQAAALRPEHEGEHQGH